jgi:nicotinamidase-related amidase
MSRLALIVVDMQLRVEGMSREMNIIEKVVSVIQACHKQGIPVFFTQHNDPDPESILRKWWGRPIIRDTNEWKLIKEIEAVADRNKDVFITGKTTYDAFHGTSLKKCLIDRGVDTVVVCGAMTNLCCETTARTAFVNNFNVIFLRDGNATSTQEFHDASIKNLEFGFATIKTCEEFMMTLKI